MAVIIALGVMILGGYASSDTVREDLERLAAWKTSLGWLYPAVSLAVVGGLLPGLLCALRDRRWPTWRFLPVVMLYWPYRGLEIDLLYRGLGALVGEDAQVSTIAIKVALDMALYVPFWALPLYLLVAAWQHGEDPRLLIRSSAFWRERYLPGVLANWLLWIPAVAIIYALPAGLQLPVQNLFMIIWILIVEVIVRSGRPS